MANLTEIAGIELEDAAFEVHDNELHVGGVAARKLLEKHGGGPLYVYDEASIHRRIARLRAALHEDIALKYAVKANPNDRVLASLARAVDGFDVASTTEAVAVLSLGVEPSRISLAGPGKPDHLLEAAVEQGIVVSLESEREVERLAALTAARGQRQPVLLRVNPDFSLMQSGMKMSGSASPFGVDVERAGTVLARLPGELELRGLHVFCGSQCLSTDSLIEMYSATFELVRRLSEQSEVPLRCLNLGSGLGIPYFQGDRPVDLERLLEHLNRLLEAARTWNPGLQLELELGRYLVGHAGVYLCSVIDKKHSRGQQFLITDGGMHHHLAASGNLGQVIKRNYPICIANRLTSPRKEVVTVAGHLCTPLDVLARDVELPAADVGDIVGILQSGAYGLSASPTAFLGHPKPAEVFVPRAAGC